MRKAFEAVIIADYDVQSAVERELVLRLASLSSDCRAEFLATSGWRQEFID
jgi:hypothetical protein